MKLPNERTFKILEERKHYLLTKSQSNDTQNGYANAEIEALTRIMDFTKLVLQSFPDEAIGKIIHQHDLNSKNNSA